MEQGTLPERYLARSVIKHIKKQNKGIRVSAAIGNDYSKMDGAITADGMGDTPWISWVKASNNFACSGGIATGVRLTLMLPQDIMESKIKEYMADFCRFAESDGIQILGGHSQVSNAFTKPQFLVTMIGKAGKYEPQKKAIKPGCEIIMIGYSGWMGVDVILAQYEDKLRERFAKFYLNGAHMNQEAYSIVNAAKILADSELDVFYMHDASHGGIYGALWQLGVWMDKGFEVNHSKVPIRQDSIEICEYLNINPYLLDSTGCLLVVTSQGDKILECLKESGIAAACIGVVTEKKEKIVIVNDVDRRCLSPVNGDESYHYSFPK